MMQALAIWHAVKALAKRIHPAIYLALAICLAIWAWGAHNYRSGHSDGREAVLADLRAAEALAKEKALQAIAEAGDAGIERAERFEAEQRALNEVIGRAEAKEGSALDALF
jgi:hypothetical protein